MAKGSLIFPFTYIKEQLRQLKSSVTSVSNACDTLGTNLSKHTSPALYTQWRDAGNTDSNTTWVETCGNLVIVHLCCSCIAYNKPTLITGLPKPKSNMYQYIGTNGNSSVVLNTQGTLAVASGGSPSGTVSAIVGTFVYFTNY